MIDVDDDADGARRVELALVSGPSKGDVVALRAASDGRDALSLLGLPATLLVERGVPTVQLDGQ